MEHYRCTKSRHMMTVLCVVLLGACLAAQGLVFLLANAGNVRAQNFPTEPLRLVVPVPAGSGADFVVRTYAQRLTAMLGQQVIVDNRGGAAGIIAKEAGARAASTLPRDAGMAGARHG